MEKKILMDAIHPEETRVAVMSEGRLEEFDVETTSKKQLRGNIYLAKVTRVEPSLQAAFVDYGGNRHGFLAFSEIHPDYYQIPVEDRQALIDAERQVSAQMAEEADDVSEADDLSNDESDQQSLTTKSNLDEGDSSEIDGAQLESDSDNTELLDDVSDLVTDADIDHEEESLLDEAELRRRKKMLLRNYKIQEVIKKRQILLVQVVKEERGNKGAALTTYLSLAGQYSVLMPNSARGCGISRKINNSTDRKRLKKVVADLQVPDGMGLIIRTAGAKRTKVEIKRDFQYLSKLYDSIRETTLKSVAPAVVHKESSIIKRTIRDMYDKDVAEVLVAGHSAYLEAKDFMKSLMPSHAKKVKNYRENEPLFLKYQAENQLANLYSPVVQMKSGGYLVIHQTEALVAIDVNSGRSTRERSVENTALRTNLEAVQEVCRQMRMRDLAGLIVIDFIDMDELKNVRAVEKKMRDCLKIDRARVQTSRISTFGLMEISRQRRRAGVLAGSTNMCQTCDGTGYVRSTESVALQCIRAIEARASEVNATILCVIVQSQVAMYLLNEKRDMLREIEKNHNIRLFVDVDPSIKMSEFLIENLGLGQVQDAIEKDAARQNSDAASSGQDQSRRSAKISSKGGRGRSVKSQAATTEKVETSESEDAGIGKKRRRGRRGGRRRKSPDQFSGEQNIIISEIDQDKSAGSKPDISDEKEMSGEGRKPRRRRSRATKKSSENLGAKESTVERSDASRNDESMGETGSQPKKNDPKGSKSKTDDVLIEPEKKKDEKKTRTKSPKLRSKKSQSVDNSGNGTAADEETKISVPPQKNGEASSADSDQAAQKKKGWWQRSNPFAGGS